MLANSGLEELNPKDDFKSYRFLQTASDRAKTVIIPVSGNEKEIDDDVVRTIPDEDQVP
jgi:hypothetical protein